nr:hypothetical protein [Ktedonobacteraceae bacterium]
MSIRSPEQVALLTDYDAGSAYSVAYHTLYANICCNWNNEQTQHTLLLTTPSTYAGQAMVAANVAIAAAQSGTPTILIDADLRSPGLAQRFGLNKSTGLSDLLLADTLNTQEIKQYLSATFIPNLHLLSAGTATEGTFPTVATKFQGILQTLCSFLQETETQPSLIICHSSAVLAGPEASLISAHVEQTMLTIIKGRTTRKQAKQAQEQLERTHAHLLGIIMLDV